MDEDIHEALKGLGYPGKIGGGDRTALERALADGWTSPEWMALVVWLTGQLQSLVNTEEAVHEIQGTASDAHLNAFLLELSAFLKELGCPYRSLTTAAVGDRLQTPADRRQLLAYLTTELQAARMCAIDEQQTKEPLAAAAGGRKKEVANAETLKKTLKALGISRPPDDITMRAVFDKLEAKVKEERAKVPPEHVGKPLFRGTLNPDQWKKVDQLNKAMMIEYDLRAQLLLKRLDVTIQSFTWSERIKEMQDEVMKVYRPLRDKLRRDSYITVVDLMAARNDLSMMVKTSAKSVRVESKINKLMLKGKVPDRGGRPTEIRAPPPEMPAWKKERAPDGRGGGGARGGGGGGRRGGGRVQRGGGGGGGYHQGGAGGHGGYQQQQQHGGYGHQGGYDQQQQHQSQYRYQDNVNSQAYYQQQQQAPAYQGYSGQQAYYDQGAGGGGNQYYDQQQQHGHGHGGGGGYGRQQRGGGGRGRRHY